MGRNGSVIAGERGEPRSLAGKDSTVRMVANFS